MWWLAMAYGMEVTVVEDPGRDRWEATWVHDEAVRGFAFTRNRNPVQAKWKAKKGRLRDLDGYQVFLAPPGKTIDRFTATFRTDTSWQNKDYELNVAFSDGARLLYTDHLFVVPLTCPDDGSDCDDAELQGGEATVHRFDLRTDDGRFVVTPDGRSEAQATWSQTSRGVYVYFGDGEPLGDDRITFLIDPGLPAWIRERTDAWIGPLLDHFESQTGRVLGFAPVVFLSYTDGPADQQSLGGGGMPGQMQLQLIGGAWRHETDALATRYATFLAHETFHMWNGEELRTRRGLGPSEEWLSEGSAELFSWWAVEALGIQHAPFAEDQALAAAARCTTDLGGQPLLTAHRAGNQGAFYPCGAAALYQLHLQADLPEVFAALFAEGATDYSTFDLLEQIQVHSEDPLAPAFAERLLRHGLGPDPATAWVAGFGSGLPVEAAETWTVDGLPDGAYHDALVTTVGACDCGGAMSVWNEGDTIRFEGLDVCEALTSELRVEQAAGVDVADRRAALQAVWEAIDTDGAFELQGADDTRTIRCPDDLAPPRALQRADGQSSSG